MDGQDYRSKFQVFGYTQEEITANVVDATSINGSVGCVYDHCAMDLF